MTISINVSEQFEERLHEAFGEDLSRAALEAMALEGYRQAKLSRYDVQRLLGFDNRYDAENWLGDHGAHLHYTLADLEADAKTLDELLGRERS